MTKNKRYEENKRRQGLSKVTFWIPEDRRVEIKSMIDFLVDNKDMIPAQCRSLKTGRFKKIPERT